MAASSSLMAASAGETTAAGGLAAESPVLAQPAPQTGPTVESAFFFLEEPPEAGDTTKPLAYTPSPTPSLGQALKYQAAGPARWS